MDRASEVADRLHSVAIRVLRHAREADREFGLGPARLSALSVLVYGGECTLGELAVAEQVTPATISRVFAGLEDLGLAERRPSEEDGRASVVSATRKGRTLLERARAARLVRIRELLAGASPRDATALGDALDAVFPRRQGA
jgi:DNA-binding MarR family transcriptional regulator